MTPQPWALSSPEPGGDHRPAKGRRLGSESGPEVPSPAHPNLEDQQGAGEGLRPLLPEARVHRNITLAGPLDEAQVQGAQGQGANPQQMVQGCL